MDYFLAQMTQLDAQASGSSWSGHTLVDLTISMNENGGEFEVHPAILGAKSRAALLGSYMVRLEDVTTLAEPVLMHRVITSFAAESEGVDSRQIVRRLVDELVKET
jgi:MoxR-like ATPase